MILVGSFDHAQEAAVCIQVTYILLRHTWMIKTTLKWSSDGELSAVDMTRILDRLANPELTECDLACDLKDSSLEDQEYISSMPLPASSWLP